MNNSIRWMDSGIPPYKAVVASALTFVPCAVALAYFFDWLLVGNPPGTLLIDLDFTWSVGSAFLCGAMYSSLWLTWLSANCYFGELKAEIMDELDSFRRAFRYVGYMIWLCALAYELPGAAEVMPVFTERTGLSAAWVNLIILVLLNEILYRPVLASFRHILERKRA